MRRTQTSDHLAYSLTDLMISLMIIFILLMIVFVNNQGIDRQTGTTPLTQELRQKIVDAGFSSSDLTITPTDPHVLTIQLPATLRFAPNEYRTSSEADRLLQQQMPKLAEVVCGERFRDKIESFTIEGYADASPFRGLPPEESRIRNLELSQSRSREVIRRALQILSADPSTVACMSDLMAASGRGQSHALPNAELSRRVAFHIRLDPSAADAIVDTTATVRDDAPPPAVPKVLRLFETLRTSAPGSVRFDLSEAEVNEYLGYALATRPRFGIHSCTLQFENENHVSAEVEIGDKALRQLPGAGHFFADHTRSGRTVKVAVQFHVSDAKVTYSLIRAQAGDVDIPAQLVRQVIRVIGMMQPEGFDTESPVPLPFSLRHIATSEGRVYGEN